MWERLRRASLVVQVTFVGTVIVIITLSLWVVMFRLMIIERILAAVELGAAARMARVVAQSAWDPDEGVRRERLEKVAAGLGLLPPEARFHLAPSGEVGLQPEGLPECDSTRWLLAEVGEEPALASAWLGRPMCLRAEVPGRGRADVIYTPAGPVGQPVQGVLELRLPSEQIKRTVPDYARYAVAAVALGLWLLCVGICSLVAALLARRVLRALVRVSDALAAVEQGRYDLRLPDDTGAQELRLIQRRFNLMAGALAERTRVLAQSELRYRTLFTGSEYGLFLLAGRRVVDVNAAAEGLIGRSRPEILGRGVEELLTLVRVEASQGLPGVIVVEVSRLTRPDGAVRLVESHSVTLEVEGEVLELLTLRDVTERHSQWERALQSNRLSLLGTFASGLAHQLNNPLVGVLNMAQLLRRRIPPTDPSAELAAMIEQSAVRCRDTVKALLTFVRRGMGSCRSVAVSELVELTLQLARDALERKGCRVEISIEPPELQVWGDPTQLVQVLANLVSNAAQAVGEGGAIKVRAGRASESVQIDVCDNGPGVPEEARAHLFEPFFTTRPAGEGTGLGLAIAEAITREHRGSLCLLPGSGPGATFRLSLPDLYEPDLSAVEQR